MGEINKFGKLSIASYQGPPVNGIDHALKVIKSVCTKAEFADIVLFPETFLQGYFKEEALARQKCHKLK